jgi:ABC-2 type transport system ATP-binding protein
MNVDSAGEVSGEEISGEALLSVEGVSFAYAQRKVLTSVSLTVPRGGFVALLGANGAGKTTLFSLITGLQVARDGDVRIAGLSIRDRRAQALGSLGVVFQQPTLDLDLTVAQNLSYFAALRGLAPKVARERGGEVLAQLDLVDRRADKVRALSGGQRRRLEIARALLHEPSLLLLDEPTVGLDIPTRRALVDYVHGLTADRKIGVLWATHLADEIEGEDEVVVLHEGRVLRDAKAKALVAETGAMDLERAFSELTGPGSAAA